MGSSRTLNFTNKQIISKEELTEWDASLRELIGNVISIKGRGKGILANKTSQTAISPDSFRVSFTSGDSTKIDISPGIGVFNIESVSPAAFSDITVRNDSLKNSQKVSIIDFPGLNSIPFGDVSSLETPLYIGLVPIFNPLEQSIASINPANNQITLTGGTTKLLRGQTYGNPSKVSFYASDGGIANDNNGIYEVVSIINDYNFIISGNLITESTPSLYMLIRGSYDLSIAGSLQNKSNYVKYEYDLVISTNLSLITSTGGFTLADIHLQSTYDLLHPYIVVLKDLRRDNLFDFTLPYNVSYRDEPEVITGEKTMNARFTINRIPSYSFNFASITTPLNPSSLNILTIPDSPGSVFVVTAATINLISTILVSYGFSSYFGDKLYIKIDSSGGDMNIQLSNSYGGVKVNGQSSGNIVIEAGSILELIRTDTENWTIINYRDSDTGWIQVTNILDSTPVTPLVVDTTINNQVFYRIKSGQCFLKFNKMYPVSSYVSPLKFLLDSRMGCLEVCNLRLPMSENPNKWVLINQVGNVEFYFDTLNFGFTTIIPYIP